MLLWLNNLSSISFQNNRNVNQFIPQEPQPPAEEMSYIYETVATEISADDIYAIDKDAIRPEDNMPFQRNDPYGDQIQLQERAFVDTQSSASKTQLSSTEVLYTSDSQSPIEDIFERPRVDEFGNPSIEDVQAHVHNAVTPNEHCGLQFVQDDTRM